MERGERLSALRGALARRFPAALPVWEERAEVMPTGVADLDRILPGGGLPRGRVTEWLCARSGGSATLLRALLQAALGRGDAVALVDGGRTLAASEWVEVAREGELTVVRPPEPGDALWCAELLVRSGAFALVVLDGLAVPLSLAPRLAHQVREAGCVFLLIRPEWAGARSAQGQGSASLRLVLTPHPPAGLAPRPPAGLAPRPPALPPAFPAPEASCGLTASLVKGAPPDHTEIRCVLPAPNRLCAHPLVPDRRGGARHGRSW